MIKPSQEIPRKIGWDSLVWIPSTTALCTTYRSVNADKCERNFRSLQHLAHASDAEDGPSVHLHCAIATELLDEISMIPLAFFYASSIVTVSPPREKGKA